MSGDCIAAVATAPGRGAVGILRISGGRTREVAVALCGSLPPPRQAALRELRQVDGPIVDRGLVLFFPAPQSYTGEDVVELQAHGGPALMNLLLQAACAAGARPARPGEFTERAFLNGRIDLPQAEAVADLIEASGAAAVRAAAQTLHGEFSRRVNNLFEQLVALRADLEAALDFADEDVPWLTAQSLQPRIDELSAGTARLLQQAAQGRRLRDGLTVAIAGRPNVGKSTLLNRLAGVDAAIVSPQAGTTRDLLREHIVLDGLPLTLIDSAGLRDTADPIEQEGVRRAWAAVEKAELLLFVADDSSGLTEADHALLQKLPVQVQLLLVLNKCDQSGRLPALACDAEGRSSVRLSAATGDGVEALVQAIRQAAGLGVVAEGQFSARSRHLDALRRLLQQLQAAAAVAGRGHELCAEHLRLAQQALDEITGRFSSEDLLGRIFAGFCIGK